ncbi:hypothetical protein BO70DRAFT_353628 [Aspergillus heteromorphus CBS 117.55]|uniref:Uncharacterized protein n=1 Tax=Aspergillus heteromorphus CBS 117.55 TaxID=1448321 RepID=A0A317W244_9EURO|nr:uncharacterized protein BO70DRAFT_353628 [Aspergillus heteromorphus CBS 117.55]PWY79317.1 hypothetical protein BO70DRAFT_353628 [Aspergillus heteromorphus CBS 117.55]
MCINTYHHYTGCGHIESFTLDMCRGMITGLRRTGSTFPCIDASNTHNLLPESSTAVCECRFEAPEDIPVIAERPYTPLEGLEGQARIIVDSVRMVFTQKKSDSESDVYSEGTERKEVDPQPHGPVPLSVIQSVAGHGDENEDKEMSESSQEDDDDQHSSEYASESEAEMCSSQPLYPEILALDTPCPVRQGSSWLAPPSPTSTASVITNPYDEEECILSHPENIEPPGLDNCRVIEIMSPRDPDTPKVPALLTPHPRRTLSRASSFFGPQSTPVNSHQKVMTFLTQPVEPLLESKTLKPFLLNSHFPPKYGTHGPAKGMVWDETGSLVNPHKPPPAVATPVSPMPLRCGASLCPILQSPKARQEFTFPQTPLHVDSIPETPPCAPPRPKFHDPSSFSSQFWAGKVSVFPSSPLRQINNTPFVGLPSFPQYPNSINGSSTQYCAANDFFNPPNTQSTVNPQTPMPIRPHPPNPNPLPIRPDPKNPRNLRPINWDDPSSFADDYWGSPEWRRDPANIVPPHLRPW